ncbi:hypothetical protein D3C71_1181430 [compost metagenome]
MVKAKGKNSSPTIPLTRASGKNTAMVTIVEDMIGTNISRVAALINSRPFSFSPDNESRRYMFSMTTIESSTTRPMATVIAPRVIILSVMSI